VRRRRVIRFSFELRIALTPIAPSLKNRSDRIGSVLAKADTVAAGVLTRTISLELKHQLAFLCQLCRWCALGIVSIGWIVDRYFPQPSKWATLVVWNVEDTVPARSSTPPGQTTTTRPRKRNAVTVVASVARRSSRLFVAFQLAQTAARVVRALVFATVFLRRGHAKQLLVGTGPVPLLFRHAVVSIACPVGSVRWQSDPVVGRRFGDRLGGSVWQDMVRNL